MISYFLQVKGGGKEKEPHYLPVEKDSKTVQPNCFTTEKDAEDHAKKLDKDFIIVRRDE